MEISKVFNVLSLICKPYCCQEGLVPYLRGKPGIGKTAVVHQFGESINAFVEVLRLSQHDSCDIKGNPGIDKEAGLTRWYPAEFLPFKGLKNSKFNDEKYGNKTIILFLDELNRARPDVLQSIFQLVRERRVGNYELMDNVVIICAGNLGHEDGCDVVDMDVALKDSFVIVDIEENLNDWITWAKKNEIHSSIISFIEGHPSYLYYEMKNRERECITPRTWHRFSKIIKANSDMDLLDVVDIIGSSIINGVYGTFRDYLISIRKVSAKEVLQDYAKYRDYLIGLKESDRAKVHMLSEEISKHLISIDWEKESVYDWEKDEKDLPAFESISPIGKSIINNFYKYMKECVFEDNYFGIVQKLSKEKILITNIYFHLFPDEQDFVRKLIQTALPLSKEKKEDVKEPDPDVSVDATIQYNSTQNSSEPEADEIDEIDEIGKATSLHRVKMSTQM